MRNAECGNCASRLRLVNRFGRCKCIPFAHEKTIPRNEVLFQGADGRESGGEIGFYKFAFSKLAYLILQESDEMSDSWGGHTADYLINDALIYPPAAPSFPYGKLV